MAEVRGLLRGRPTAEGVLGRRKVEEGRCEHKDPEKLRFLNSKLSVQLSHGIPLT
jgi:hypothetical protein